MEANDPKIEPEKLKKDRWDKIDVIMKPVGALITALTLAGITFIASNYLNKSQEREAKTKLYTELMTRREDSESALRKDMFNSIMNNILRDNNKATLDEKILQLELLTYNFHESLNVMPLFEYLIRRNNEENQADSTLRNNYKRRLIKMAKEIGEKQLFTLEAGSSPHIFIYEDTLYSYRNSPKYKNDPAYKKRMDSLWDDNSNVTYQNEDNKTCNYYDSVPNGKSQDKVEYKVRLSIVNYDIKEPSVQVSMRIETNYLGKNKIFVEPKEKRFSVNYYEFPMIDNTRIENDKRVAVVMSDIGLREFNLRGQKSIRIEFKVVFFPGSRSGLREKPYFEDIVSKLLPEN
jgi:hypothetical protein